MIDGYMLGMYPNLRCHVFLEVLPNSSASPKKKIFYAVESTCCPKKQLRPNLAQFHALKIPFRENNKNYTIGLIDNRLNFRNIF